MQENNSLAQKMIESTAEYKYKLNEELGIYWYITDFNEDTIIVTFKNKDEKILKDMVSKWAFYGIYEEYRYFKNYYEYFVRGDISWNT